MNIPHCPHEQQTITVSRATVLPQSPPFEVDDDKRTELDELLRASLSGFKVSRKRKKHTNTIEGHSALHDTLEAPPFRLLSVTYPPKVISLEPKPLPTRMLWEPPCEDNDLEAEIRCQQALSAAVDLPSLFKSAEAYISLPQKVEKVIHASSDVSLSSVAFFLAEMPAKKPRRLGVLHDRTLLPSPHEVKPKGDALPVISLELQGDEQPARRKRKRRRKTVEKPPATFWRPLRGWGGKSSGYAMGYEGSWPVEHEYELRYVRDKMRKAVFIESSK